MEKNGNTFSRGDKVVSAAAAGTKQASPAEGEVRDVDIATEQALVKWASGQEQWLPLSQLERAGR